MSTPPSQGQARLRLATLAVMASMLAVAPHAAARDAVGPPPLICPPGYQGVPSHAGARCEENAPKRCPVGWHGVLGGDCTLEPCRGGQCAAGKACVQHAVCLEPKQDDSYDWNEVPSATLRASPTRR